MSEDKGMTKNSLLSIIDQLRGMIETEQIEDTADEFGKRRCGTCAKWSPRFNLCKALTRAIGKKKDCFAWTDDSDWESKWEESCRIYGNR